MRLKPRKSIAVNPLNGKVEQILNSEGKFLTETQLADILGLNIKNAVIKAAKLGFSRIRVSKSRYYSKKQVREYLVRQRVSE